VWAQVHIALSPQGNELSPRGSWGICAPALPEGLTSSRFDKLGVPSEDKDECEYEEETESTNGSNSALTRQKKRKGKKSK
jgi:hypothetical protein